MACVDPECPSVLPSESKGEHPNSTPGHLCDLGCILQLSASESPHLWSGFLPHLILQLSECWDTVTGCVQRNSIRIGRQNKGQVQGQRKRQRGRERGLKKGLLP